MFYLLRKQNKKQNPKQQAKTMENLAKQWNFKALEKHKYNIGSLSYGLSEDVERAFTFHTQ